MMTKLTLRLTVLLLLTLATTLWAGDVIPTSEWTDFGSSNTTINGMAAPIGVLIDAYDNTGVHCGRDTVHTIPGRYGAMPVYGDDLLSEDVDEGCNYGEHVVFKVNGKLATELGPADDLWLGKGPTKIMDLSITQTFGLDLSGVPGHFGNPGDTVTYIVSVHNTGDGIDLLTFEATSEHGWEVIEPASWPTYIDPDETIDVTVKVVIPEDATADQTDLLTVTGTSTFDISTTDTYEATTSVGQLFGLSLYGLATQVAGAGDTVHFNGGIDNLGNGEDEVEIEVQSSAGWPILDLPTTPQMIDAYGTIPLSIQVKIPDAAPQGSQNILTIIVTSTNDPDATDTLKVTTTVGIMHQFIFTDVPGDSVGDPGDAILYSPVKIKNVGGAADHATVTATSSLGWTIDEPTNSDAGVPPSASLSLDYTVHIPGDATIGSRDTLTIVVVSQEDASQPDTVKIVTLVGIIYGIDLTGPSSGNATPGGSATYAVKATNTGNVDDDFDFEVTSAQGWALSGLPSPTESISAGDFKTFNIKVTSPSDSKAGDADTLTVIATSQGAGGNADTLKIITTVKINYAPVVTESQENLGLPGDDVHYTIGVYNLGSVVDSFFLSVTSSKGWSLTGVPAYSAAIVPFGNQEFDLVVSIPPDATPGDVDTVTFIATSQNDADAADTSLVITTVDQPTAVNEDEYTLPGQFSLSQNFPNPFNMETVISFNLAKPAEVELAIYDVLGRRVQTLTAGYLQAGAHTLGWNGTDANGIEVASGLYFYRLSAGEASLTRKMVLLK